MEIVTTAKAPQAIGPYSQAIKKGGMLFASGQIGLSPETQKMVDGGVEAQCRQCFENLKAVLGAGGASLEQLVKLTVYVVDIENFGLVNQVMEGVLSSPFPARALVEVSALPKGALVELDAIVMLD